LRGDALPIGVMLHLIYVQEEDVRSADASRNAAIGVRSNG